MRRMGGNKRGHKSRERWIDAQFVLYEFFLLRTFDLSTSVRQHNKMQEKQLVNYV